MYDHLVIIFLLSQLITMVNMTHISLEDQELSEATKGMVPLMSEMVAVVLL
jgi:hypothetical protein